MLQSKLKTGNWVWDIRSPPNPPPRIGAARASKIANERILMIGTDMAVGKMTAGLELTRCFIEKKINAKFLATGQTGICISGSGIPLDSFKVDHASGAVEELVLRYSDREIVVIEGQGSLLNPGSTATLPLMRGSCPTSMILCHKYGLKVVESETEIKIPALAKVIELNEFVASTLGCFSQAKVVGVALDTRILNKIDAESKIKNTEDELGIPVTDPVRFGASKLADIFL